MVRANLTQPGLVDITLQGRKTKKGDAEMWTRKTPLRREGFLKVAHQKRDEY